MKYVIFDTETTGLQPHDEVIQLCYITVSSDFKICNAGNFYAKPTIPIPQGSIRIHGITNDMIKELSNNSFLDKQIQNHPDLLDTNNTIFVAYNIYFDKFKVNHSLTNLAHPPIDFGRFYKTLPTKYNYKGGNGNFCLMKGMTDKVITEKKNIRLSQCVDRYAPYISDDFLKKQYDFLHKISGVDFSNGNNFHNAKYDTLMSALLFLYYRNLLTQ